MRSTFAGLNIVTRGLAAQQLSLDTTSHNVANANTPGYSRQTVNLTTTMPENIIGANGQRLMVGTGVDAQSITRARDAFIDKQYWQEKGTQSRWQSQADTLSKIENIFSDTEDSGVQATLNKFWQALQTLAANAADYGARTNVRETANALVQLLKEDYQQLVSLANNIANQVAVDVAAINNFAQQIADLNRQIVQQESAGATANDLRDKRDNLVDQLATLTDVQVAQNKDGSYSVSVSGIVLVEGGNVSPLTVVPSHNDYYNFDTNKVVAAGQPPLTVNFTGGELGGLMQGRQDIVGYLDRLDNMAKFLMQDINAQHKAGYDLNGAAGDNFFGQSGIDYSDPANAPTNGWINALQVNAVFYETDGLQKIAAKSEASAGSANGENMMAMADTLMSRTSATLGGATFSGYYGELIGTLGVQSQQAQNMVNNQTVLVNATVNWRESISGVNIDEEMANMIKFQKGYAAAATVMSTMSQLLDTLINSVGRST